MDIGIISSGTLFKEINNLFENFQDESNQYIFAGSSLGINVTDENVVEAKLTLNINKEGCHEKQEFIP